MISKYKPIGWRNESHRHYLAAKGISTKKYHAHKYYAFTPTFVASDLPLIAGDAVGTAGVSVVALAPLAGPLLFLGAAVFGAAKVKDKFFVVKDGYMLRKDDEYMAKKTVKAGTLKKVNDVAIVAEKVEHGKVFPVSPEEVENHLNNTPEEHLKGLKEIRFVDPRDKEQEQAWAQYVRSRRTILIFSQPNTNGGKVDGQDPQMVNKHIREFVLPHEIGHHRALHIEKITDKNIEMAEARANANVVGMDPDDKDVKVLQA